MLLLAADPGARELMLDVLGDRDVTVCETPAQARARIRATHYVLVIVTNFGVRPFEAVEIIPAERDYTVMFLTGHMDDRLREQCRERRISWWPVPMEPREIWRELRLALEDVTL